MRGHYHEICNTVRHSRKRRSLTGGFGRYQRQGRRPNRLSRRHRGLLSRSRKVRRARPRTCFAVRCRKLLLRGDQPHRYSDLYLLCARGHGVDRGNISASAKEFLASLPLSIEQDGLYFTHSSPSSTQDWIYVFPDSEEAVFEAFNSLSIGSISSGIPIGRRS